MPSQAIERLLEIDLQLQVVIVEKDILLGDVLRLCAGMIIPFDKRIEDPLELQVNNRPIASGEAVRLGGRFGLQVVDIGPVQERIESMGE